MDSYSNEQDYRLNLSLPKFVSCQHHVIGEVIRRRDAR